MIKFGVCMRKYLKLFFIFIGILLTFILLDTIQALMFNHNPIIGVETHCRRKVGIFVDTYHCDGKNITRLKKTNLCYDDDVCRVYSNEDDVVLTVKEETLTKTGATFILKNNTDKEYWYGADYRIEKGENDGWYELDTITGEPLSWNDIAYILKANEVMEIHIDWSYGYGELKNGDYRLVKTTFREEDQPIDESKKYYLYAEFSIS